MSNKPLFLVVDDDPVSRLMLCRSLEKSGYETIAEENGAKALAAFDRRRPDVVLLDAKMPVMDGFEACRAIKQCPGGDNVPVLMITGLNDEESVDKAYEAGAADFITKPIHWAILRNRVQYLIKVLEAERQLYLAAGVIESTDEGIVVTDSDSIIQSVNPAFARITGYSAAEAVGRSMNLLKSGHHDREFYRNMWECLRNFGNWKGEIWNRRKNGEIYPQWANINAIKSPTGQVSNFVVVFTDLTAAKESEESLLYITGHDALTDLPNRLLFYDRLGHALNDARRDEKGVAVLLLDLDRFKVINDTIGHDVGDRLLVKVSEKLNAAMPEKDMLFRMGGDEFGVILGGLDDSRQAVQVAQGILEVLARPFTLDDMDLFIGGSIGIGLFPGDGPDVKTLVKNTDAAMYHAKEQGRNNFQFYRNELNTTSLARMMLEGSLRNALEREEFLLFYQPQIDLKSGRMVGMEALMRWRHPERGMISPGEFIPLAEESGLIIPMGRWALLTACRQNRAWQEAGFPPLRMAVNLSGLQFNAPDFTDQVFKVLGETGLDPATLELELTESIAMGDVEETLAKLHTLDQVNMHLAIDDFGTGFSSLSYLKRFPIDTLKIDQSFVRNCTSDPEDAAIIRAFISLAHSLGLRVIAEGVETAEQLQFLQQEDCDEVQGYYFSRPLPADRFAEYMVEHFQRHPSG
ncbi:MAG: EAL domain-containing protein [Magnetococcales bacterium]|nr:EAL domain-containing protein [Magnetococcales bacterium]